MNRLHLKDALIRMHSPFSKLFKRPGLGRILLPFTVALVLLALIALYFSSV
jgi:hypothetical protein